MPSILRLAGVDELLRELAGLAPDLLAESRPLVAAQAARTADEVRAALPVATGALRASVHVVTPGGTGPGRLATRVVVGADYAEFVEFGTPLMPARPVFVSAVRRGRQAFAAAVIARVRARGLVVGGETRDG